MNYGKGYRDCIKRNGDKTQMQSTCYIVTSCHGNNDEMWSTSCLIMQHKPYIVELRFSETQKSNDSINEAGQYAEFLKGGFDNFFGKLLIMCCNLKYTCTVKWQQNHAFRLPGPAPPLLKWSGVRVVACEAHRSRGVWGHAPPESFRILVMLRSHLVQFGGNTARVNCMLQKPSFDG